MSVSVGFSLRPLVLLFSAGTVDEEPSSVTGRKDSLSINLEFVKVSLSRMRRSGGPTFTESFIPPKGGKIDTTLINISGKSHPERGGFSVRRATGATLLGLFLSQPDTALVTLSAAVWKRFSP